MYMSPIYLCLPYYSCRIMLSNGQCYANRINFWHQSLENAYQSVYKGNFSCNFFFKSIQSRSSTARNVAFSSPPKIFKHYVLFMFYRIISNSVFTLTALYQIVCLLSLPWASEINLRSLKKMIKVEKTMNTAL